jgi:hypothetical protein
LPVENFQQIYSDFLDEVIDRINIDKIASVAIEPLIFNQ